VSINGSPYNVPLLVIIDIFAHNEGRDSDLMIKTGIVLLSYCVGVELDVDITVVAIVPADDCV